MKQSKQFWLVYVIPFALFTAGLASLAGCVPIAEPVPRPTLNEVRSGTARGQITEDLTLRPAEFPAEVAEIDRARRELRVISDDGRTRPLAYDLNTKVIYHGWEYTVDHLEAGDRIAYQLVPRDSRYVSTIRIQEPVQARVGRTIARPAPPLPRSDVVEGTVERVNYELGVFDIRPRTGRMVTVSIPYNARTADVENFRGLRRGDYVRVEGEYVNPDSFQLLAFLSPRDR
ncbi:MAG TPA: hypothetical protein VGK77_19615 [Candidatus Binatia bacterium]